MKSTKDWLIAIVGVMFALAVIAAVTYVSLDPSVTEETRTIVWVIIPIVAIVTHIIALVKVRRGTLTVYCGWKDFGISCIWPITAILTALPLVIVALAETRVGEIVALLVSGLFAFITIVSLVWMFFGAFTNNRGKLVGGFVALVARTTATLFFITYVGKLLDIGNKYRGGNAGVGDYVRALVGFAIFGIWFKLIVVPLVKDNREDVGGVE